MVLDKFQVFCFVGIESICQISLYFKVPTIIYKVTDKNNRSNYVLCTMSLFMYIRPLLVYLMIQHQHGNILEVFHLLISLQPAFFCVNPCWLFGVLFTSRCQDYFTRFYQVSAVTPFAFHFIKPVAEPDKVVAGGIGAVHSAGYQLNS